MGSVASRPGPCNNLMNLRRRNLASSMVKKIVNSMREPAVPHHVVD